MHKTRLIVHMVGNAHLDPAWLWTWPSGVDEALATCRTACDLLDDYPALHVTRGEAWVHAQIARLDPATFRRIRRHVAAGRWHVVNGWWIQPDCNLPSPESFLKQAEVGGKFLRERLGVTVKVGYNVDSFGHCAMLPTYLRRSGQDAYVFLRPDPREFSLPSNLFRWRSPAGDEVLTFRIATYNAFGVFDLQKNVEREVGLAPREVGHTMCFYGLGDHGGGPTRDQIEWIQDHRHWADDVELRFSHPQAFFGAVRRHTAARPVFTGELNPHAIGCYTVVRDLKREVRRAENMLLQAGAMAASRGVMHRNGLAGRFEDAWRTLLFNQFHDVLGGSSIPAVCAQALEELGQVKCFARGLIVDLTRRANVGLPPCTRQRIVLDNPGDTAWSGPVEFSPWLQQDGAPSAFVLLDGAGSRVPSQPVVGESPSGANPSAVLFHAAVPAHGRRVLELRRGAADVSAAGALAVEPHRLSNALVTVTCGANGLTALTLGKRTLLGPPGVRVCVFADDTDTWSHGAFEFNGALLETFASAVPWTMQERGPLRAALSNTLTSASGSLFWTVQLLDGGPAVRLRLRLTWRGENRIVKLLVPPAFRPVVRRDGTPGAILERPLDGREYPVRDILSVAGRGAALTTVSTDVFGCDVQPDGTMRLTLLRCPGYAHHMPRRLPEHAPYPVTDQGTHDYEIVLLPSREFPADAAAAEARRRNSPLWISETTKGMPAGWRYDNPPRHLPHGQPPVPPVGALLPEALLGLARNGVPPHLVQSATLCPSWSGERLLVSSGPTLRLRLSIPVEAKYRLTMARASGGVFGPATIVIGGRRLGVLAGAGRKPRPALDVVPDVPLLSGEVTLELAAGRGQRLALGFLHIAPVYRDLPASAWLVAGPFSLRDPAADARAPLEDVATALRQRVFAPERARRFDDPVALEDGSAGRWMRPRGEGDYVDFKVLTGRLIGSVHYAVTHIWSDAARTARFCYGVDYWARIWLNGDVVNDGAVPTGAPFKGQSVLDAPLRQGWNELMLKVASGSNGNGFWLAIADSGGLRFSQRVPGSG